ncbi:Outer membrane efflux protein (fragment) [Acidobacteriia bacterium SbA2]
MCFRSRHILVLLWLVGVIVALPVENGLAQCAAIASTPAAASECAAHELPDERIATIDPKHPYSLAELIDIAERNNPRTRIVWEQAKQKAKQLGIERSSYFPVLAAVATFGDQRFIAPFPKPLAPLGYTVNEARLVQPEITLEYVLFDFGKREARIDAAKAGALAAGAIFIQANQEVAFAVASDYYKLVTAQERLQAAQETLKTAQTTQDAAEDRLQNGRATLPDVLNARAETAQAVFDLESADGDEKIARVTLAEELGVEPSLNIVIDAQKNAPLPESLSLPIDELIERAMADRPDLAAQIAEIRAADADDDHIHRLRGLLGHCQDIRPRAIGQLRVREDQLGGVQSSKHSSGLRLRFSMEDVHTLPL